MINKLVEHSQIPVQRMEQVAINKVKETKVQPSKEGSTSNSNHSNSNPKEERSIENKEKVILDAIEKASGKIELDNKGLQFSIHEKTNQIMVKVVDTNTKEVIKELPSEKILDMIAKMVELSGSFIDEKR